MRHHSRVVGLGAAAALLLAGAVWAFLAHSSWERRVSRYKAELRASGEKLAMKDVLPQPLLPDKNGVGIFRTTTDWEKRPSLLDSNPPIAMRMAAPGKAMIGWKQPAIADDRMTNTWDEVEAALEKNQEAIERLHELIAKPALDFGLDYSQGFNLLLPHLSRFKKTAQMLSAAALRDLRRGDTASATTQLRTSLALTKGLRDEPLVISQLVRMAAAQITVAANWEFLQSTNVTDEQLADLQREWISLDLLQPAEASLEFERAMCQDIISQMRRSSAQFRRYAAGWGGPGSSSSSGDWLEKIGQTAIIKAKETGWRFSWSYEDELRALKGNQVLLDSLRQARRSSAFSAAITNQDRMLRDLNIQVPKDEGEPRLDVGEADLHSMFSQSILSLRGVIKRVMIVEVARDLTITALALKRYHLRHGNYPASLENLVPEFLVSVPRDAVDGQALRYRQNPDGTFLLYSIGADGEDNGGDASPPSEKTESNSWQRGRDLVWPQPASEEEIAAFRKKLKH